MVTGQFSDSYPPIMDGVALAVANYVAELSRTLGPSYAVVPAAAHGARGQAPEQSVRRYFSVPLAARAPYRVGLPRVDFVFHAALHRIAFDLVHAHSPFSAGRLALRVARHRGIPIVATFHSKYRDNFEQVTRFAPVVERALRWVVDFYHAVDEVWVPTQAALATLREYGYRGAAHVVRNGVDLTPAADSGPLRRRGDRFRVAFVGEGYAANAMQGMIASLDLSDCTSFHGVVRDRALLAACYARADCLLFPSLYETNGLVVSEAAAFGVPSLLVQGSAATEGTVDGVNAFVTENSASACAARLHELLARPDLLAEVGRAARRSLYRPWSAAVAEARDRYIRLARRREPCGEPMSA